MAALPSEILAAILSRIPAKSLLRFKCVCKSWNSLIKSPNFIKLHLKQTLISNSDRHLLVSSEYSSSLHSADLDLDLIHNRISYSELHHPLKHHNVVKLVGSCNGVVCISDESKNDVVLYNPLTKSRREIPVDQISNPSIDFIVLGFGYDSKNDDYKVLRVVDESEVTLYSSNNNSWKTVGSFPYYLCYRGFSGLLVNEALHFMVTKELESQFKFIVSFNLQTESFSLIECPKDDNMLRSDLMFFLAELGGCLCLVLNIHNENLADLTPDKMFTVRQFANRVDLWVMKEHGKKESWMRLFSICKPENLGALIEIKPVVYAKDGRKILLEIDGERLGWYDVKSNKFDRCTVRGRPNEVVDTVCFIGSLVSFGDKPRLERGTSAKKNKKKVNLDNFLSKGFKLRL